MIPKLDESNKIIKLFRMNGTIFEGVSGNQAYGKSMFADKFYVNMDNGLWDSKTRNISGNIYSFLDRCHKIYKKKITEQEYEALSRNRGIPVEALKKFEIGKRRSEYTIPIRDEKNKICNLKSYRVGRKLIGSPVVGNSIWGIERLVHSDPKIPVYICEGEWDGIIMQWLLDKNRINAIAVSLPGATSFVKDWVKYFYRRECIILMDNDAAGESGERKIFDGLNGEASSMKFIHWSDHYPEKFDIRDFVSVEAVKNKRPKRCMSRLMHMLKNHPRKISEKEILQLPEEKPKIKVDSSVTWESLKNKIQKWMRINDFNPLKISTAVLLSNFIVGDPVWMFLVACPGVGKSETLGMFKSCDDVYTTSSITPNALISGAISYKGKEPSLLPKLDGKMLCIKDFSTIQTMRDNDRDSLLGILRDAYDGSAGKVFGTGESKHFESKFSMLAGVTPSIYQMEHHFSSLGERFLKVFIGEYLDHKDQYRVIEQAMKNVGKEDKMREEFSNNMYSFIENTKNHMSSPSYVAPVISRDTEKKIVNLAMWCSRMKGTVNRDKYERDVITNKAYSEIGTRTGKQLKRLLLCFPTVIYSGKETEEDYELIKQVAVDSVSAKREDIFRSVYISCVSKEDTVDIKQIVQVTKYDYSTALRSVDDLVALNILERVGFKKPYQYRATKNMNDCTKFSGLYSSAFFKNRPYKLSYAKLTKGEQ